MRLAEGYLREAGNFENVHSLNRNPRHLYSDPLYAVIGESIGPRANDRKKRLGSSLYLSVAEAESKFRLSLDVGHINPHA